MKKIFLLLLIVALSDAILAQNSPTFRYQNYLRNKQMYYDSNAKRWTLEENQLVFDTVNILKRRCHYNNITHKKESYVDTSNFVSFTETGFFQIGQLRAYNMDTLNSYLYNQATVDVLQSFSIENFAANNSILNVELASFLFGPVRLGLGGSFKTTKDKSKDDSIKTDIQKIVANGGAINMNFLIPLMFVKNYSGQLHFGIFAQSYNGLTPGADSTGQNGFFNDPLFTNSSGIMLHFDVASNDKRGRLFFEIPCTYTWGPKSTYSALGISDYSLVQLQVGAVLGDLLSFRVTGPLYSTSNIVQRSPFTMSLQFSPSQVSKTISSSLNPPNTSK